MVDLLTGGRENCCGCGSCVLVCPKHAITMEPRELGCLYPKINPELCVNCGLCARSCAYRSAEERNANIISAYAAVSVDDVLLRKSASGGVFAVLAKQILREGGVVFGCALEKNDSGLKPVHIGIDEESQLHKLQGSKYVQSDLGNTFRQIRDLLALRRLVLFSGTPCQVDALKHFLANADVSRLFTIDIICHGVPSAELFGAYQTEMAVGEIESFQFRDKTLGWGLNASYECTDRRGRRKKHLLSPGVSSYYSYFLQGETYRESCYTCRYANTARVGDITIGDFWGIEQEHPELLKENGGEIDTLKGVSCILVNTEKGRELLECCGEELQTEASRPEKVIKWNRQLRFPSKHTDIRRQLIETYRIRGYSGIESVFRRNLGIRYFVRKLRNLGMARKQ